ncbi:MAG: hypothetical protein OXC00_10295 [Acidimicrobiaceae bacterium]|nr:hypothetical protein [Acidimicrobiaceae bacterium]
MTAVEGGYTPISVGEIGRDQTVTANGCPPAGTAAPRPDAWRGFLVGVIGARGAGSSLLAMCLAADLASDASNRGLVLLADVAGYDLLLGLLGREEAAGGQDGPYEAGLEALLGAYRFVVADVEADPQLVLGTEPPGAADRAGLAWATLRRSDLIVVVGTGDTWGVRSLVHNIEALAGFTGAERILPVVNRLPRSFKRRSTAAAEIGRLLASSAPFETGDPVLIAERSSIGRNGRDRLAQLSPLVRPLAAEVRMRLATASRVEDMAAQPVLTALVGD